MEQDSVTREHLNSRQQRGIVLPDGPVILRPDDMTHSFEREVLDGNARDLQVRTVRTMCATADALLWTRRSGIHKQAR